jgi:prepilin peptidase CpaA
MGLAIVLAKGRLRAALGNATDLLRPWLLRLAALPAPAAPMRQPSVGSMPYGVAIAAGTLLVLAASQT